MYVSSQSSNALEPEQISREHDILTDEEHTSFDAMVMGSFNGHTKMNEIPKLDVLLLYIAFLDSRLETLSHEAAKKLIKENPAIATILRGAWQAGSFKDVRRLAILWLASEKQVKHSPVTIKHPVSTEDFYDELLLHPQYRATEFSWTREFVGDAALELWNYIKFHYFHQSRFYGNYIDIVQSSGMGKSRMVDEMSKSHFVIPMNLMESSSKGYPPADHVVRKYLCTGSSDPFDAFLRASAFLSALFDETASVLLGEPGSVAISEGLPPIHFNEEVASLATQFRAYMSHGMMMTSHGSFRTEFYAKVIDNAERVAYPLCQAYMDLRKAFMHRVSSNPPSSISSDNFPPIRSFKGLEDVLCNNPSDNSPLASGSDRNLQPQVSTKKDIGGREPVVVIAVDEAHTMMTSHHAYVTGCFPIHQWKYHTTNLFRGEGQERGLSEGLSLIAPYTDLGFDQVAKKLAQDGKSTLFNITSDDHISHYGRPMYVGTRLDYNSAEIKEGIIPFAVMKLLGGVKYDFRMGLDDKQKLACLAQRLPIEFNSRTHADRSQDMEQVEAHLRVCLKIDAGFQTVQTVAPSEPLLSEAAYWLMQINDFDAVESLKQVLQMFAVHKGDRGELLVMLLLTLARDADVGPPNRHWKAPRRWTSITALFRSLFHLPTQGGIPVAKGSAVNRDSVTNYDKTFRLAFEDSTFYFTHWIKAHEFGHLNVKYLLSLYCRGAAILYGNNPLGVHGIMPFLWRGIKLRPDNIGVCMWQVKNGPSYTDRVDTSLFKMMDPIAMKIFGDHSGSPIPIIRMVFALTADVPSVQVVKSPPIASIKPFITYDIWCSGLSPQILRPVTKQNKYVWEDLLKMSQRWRDTYDGTASTGLRRSMNPGATLDPEHWSQWCDM